MRNIVLASTLLLGFAAAKPYPEMTELKAQAEAFMKVKRNDDTFTLATPKQDALRFANLNGEPVQMGCAHYVDVNGYHHDNCTGTSADGTYSWSRDTATG